MSLITYSILEMILILDSWLLIRIIVAFISNRGVTERPRDGPGELVAMEEYPIKTSQLFPNAVRDGSSEAVA